MPAGGTIPANPWHYHTLSTEDIRIYYIYEAKADHISLPIGVDVVVPDNHMKVVEQPAK
jgi:hypothetical protein